MAFLITEQLWKPIREKKIEKNWKYGMSRRVGQGLVVKAEDSRQGGSNPIYGDNFSGTLHLDQSLEQSLWKILTWHCCLCCSPANGRVEFEERLAYKIQLHGTK